MPAIVNCHHHYSAKSPSIKPTLRTAIDNVVCFPHTKPTLIPSAWLGQFAVVGGGQVDAKNFITQESFHLHFVPAAPHTT